MISVSTRTACLTASLLWFFTLTVSWPAVAKEWKGMHPGKTTKSQVLDKFGAPTKEFSKGGKLSDGVRYEGDEAIEGALQADFFFDINEKLFRMDIVPARELTRKQVARVYGKDYLEGTTKKGLKYIRYGKKGLTVFFEQDSNKVMIFLFTRGTSDQK